METQHVLEPGADGVSWAAEEQTLPATIPRLTSRISPASRDKAMRAPEVSEGHGAGGDVASLGWGEGAMLDRDDPVGHGGLGVEGVM